MLPCVSSASDTAIIAGMDMHHMSRSLGVGCALTSRCNLATLQRQEVFGEGLMEVARMSAVAGPWSGKALQYTGEVFVLEDFGPVAFDWLSKADTAGAIIWVNTDARDWVRALPATPPPRPQPQPEQPAQQPQPKPLQVSESTKGTVFYGLAVVLAVLLAASSAREGMSFRGGIASALGVIWDASTTPLWLASVGLAVAADRRGRTGTVATVVVIIVGGALLGSITALMRG